MLQLTVNDIIHGDWNKLDPDDEPVCIYLVRDGEAVLYIGMANDPFSRLLAHFGVLRGGGGAILGRFYKEFEHEAYAWIIELYAIEECEGITKKKCRDKRGAELAMITHFSPCINEANNVNPGKLPEKYTKVSNMFGGSTEWLDDSAVDKLTFLSRD